jgi:hypothetical protein
VLLAASDRHRLSGDLGSRKREPSDRPRAGAAIPLLKGQASSHPELGHGAATSATRVAERRSRGLTPRRRRSRRASRALVVEPVVVGPVLRLTGSFPLWRELLPRPRAPVRRHQACSESDRQKRSVVSLGRQADTDTAAHGSLKRPRSGSRATRSPVASAAGDPQRGTPNALPQRRQRPAPRAAGCPPRASPSRSLEARGSGT